jgi:hypothetical protein
MWPDTHDLRSQNAVTLIALTSQGSIALLGGAGRGGAGRGGAGRRQQPEGAICSTLQIESTP